VITLDKWRRPGGCRGEVVPARQKDLEDYHEQDQRETTLPKSIGGYRASKPRAPMRCGSDIRADGLVTPVAGVSRRWPGSIHPSQMVSTPKWLS
jgi:hypothetical protein